MRGNDPGLEVIGSSDDVQGRPGAVGPGVDAHPPGQGGGQADELLLLGAQERDVLGGLAAAGADVMGRGCKALSTSPRERGSSTPTPTPLLM